MAQNRQLRVFLCYASQDKPLVRELHQRLTAEGWIDPWLDEEKIALGQFWTNVIEDALESSDVVIIFLSKNSVQKEGFVQRELEYAWELSLQKPRDVIFLIPFRLDESEVPKYLRSRHWGNYFGEYKESTYHSLIRSLHQRYQQKLELEAKIQALPERKKDAVQEAVGENTKYGDKLTREESSSPRSPTGKFVGDSRSLSSNYMNNVPSVQYEFNKPLPPSNILLTNQITHPDERLINRTALLIEKTLAEFGIVATVIGFRAGPAIIQFAVQPGLNFKKTARYTIGEQAQQIKKSMAEIASLQKDLALALSTEKIRIEAPVPGKPYVGIELPNTRHSIIGMRSILETEEFHKVGTSFGLPLGCDIYNKPVIADLTRISHLLIAGIKGSGKSVCLSSIAACLAMRNTPNSLRMVMIDSRMGPLLSFNDLPHLYGRVETDIKRFYNTLHWLIVEMERRYKLFEAAHVIDLENFNRRITYQNEGKPIPRLVAFVDELADIMMYGPKQVEHDIVSLAKRGHVTGIHLILATKHLSSDVLTRSIKANIFARIAFAVSTETDSRIILDMTGAESLLGRGDLLFLNTGANNPSRAQGVMITDKEIESIISYWRKDANLNVDVIPPWEMLPAEPEESDEALLQNAIAIVRQGQRASASLLQRRLRVGFPRASRLLDQLEERGIVGPSKGGGKERDVLVEPVSNDN